MGGRWLSSDMRCPFLRFSSAGVAAAEALKEGTSDVMFLANTADAPLYRSLLRDPGIRVMSLRRAEAFTRIYPFLVRLVLPEGVIDPVQNIPATDVTVLATTNAIIVREDIHPAIVGDHEVDAEEPVAGSQTRQRDGSTNGKLPGAAWSLFRLPRDGRIGESFSVPGRESCRVRTTKNEAATGGGRFVFSWSAVSLRAGYSSSAAFARSMSSFTR